MIIAPSILAADFLDLKTACNIVNDSAAEYIHLDVMDGHFVPNISFGIPVVEHVRKATQKICDVHLMIEKPEKFIDAFHKAGADIITVHAEACNHLHRVIEQISQLGIKAGVALNPHTSIHVLDDILQNIDMVCIMSVNPGFGGQKFIQHSLDKISRLKQEINKSGLRAKIEVDGGVTLGNAKQLADAGADILVAGTTVFGAENPKEVIRQLSLI